MTFALSHAGDSSGIFTEAMATGTLSLKLDAIAGAIWYRQA